MGARSYKEILLAELGARRRKNAGYSMRSLARDVGVSSGFLSQVISGKRNLSEVKAHQIIERLNIPQSRAHQFLNSLRCAKVADPGVRSRIRGELKRSIEDGAFAQLEETVLPLVSHWLSFALIEMLSMPKCPGTPQWMARRLGVSVVEVSVALERLALARLVACRNGRYTKTQGDVTTPNISSAAIKKHHASILAKAGEALTKVSFAERDVSTVTMCIDPALLPEARLRIQDFRRELMEFLESGARSQLFVMHINLFRLDKDTE